MKTLELEIFETRKTQKQYRDRMREIIDTAAADGRAELNEDESKEWSEIEEKAEGALRMIDKLERLQAVSGEKPAVFANTVSRASQLAGVRGYRSMFGQNGSAGGFKNLNEFLEVLSSDRLDPRLNSRAMGEALGMLGGYLVPEEFAAEILDAALEQEIVRPRAKVFPMTSDTKKFPGFQSDNHTSSLFGGISGEWLAESATATDRDARFRILNYIAKKLAIYSRCSNELLADGMNFESAIGEALVKAVAWFLDLAFLTGDGAGKPLGVLNDPALITVSKEGSQTADTILYENIVNMFARLHPAFVQNAEWFCSQTAIPQLMKLSITIGSSGEHVPVLNEQNGKFSLLGKPLTFTEKLPVVGDKGDILLADLGQYGIGLRKEVTLEKSNAPGWQQDEMAYRCILRCDGMGLFDKPFTPKNGSTLSWAVTLEAR